MKYNSMMLDPPRDLNADEAQTEINLRYVEIRKEFETKHNTTDILIQKFKALGMTEDQIQFVLDNMNPKCHKEVIQKKYLKLMGEAYKNKNWIDFTLYSRICYSFCTFKQRNAHSKEI